MLLGPRDAALLVRLDAAVRPLPAAAVEVVLDAADEAADRASATSARLGVVLEGEGADAHADRVRDRHLLVVPVDDPTQARFDFAHGDDFGAVIERLAPALSAVRLRWHPDDEPETKKAQALGLTKLAAWLHETDRTLLLDLTVEPDDPTSRDERTREAIAEIRDLGVEADLWGVGVSIAGFAELATVVVDAGRDHAGFLVRVPDDAGATTLREARADVAAYRGILVGPGRWTAELTRLERGDSDRAATVTAIATDLAALIDHSTAPSA